MICAFIVVVILVGVYARRHAHSVSGFVLGGRNVGPWLSAFAYGTSYFSAVIFVGYAGQFGWKYGISAFWIGLGNAVLGSLLAWWVLGPRTREMTQRLQAATMPEFFGKRYGSRALRIASAAIIFVFLIPYTASVYNGLSRLFTMAFGIPYEACVIGMAAVTCVYVVLGGYMATVMNDFLQGIVMLVGIVAVIAVVLGQNGGFSASIVALSQIQAEGTDLQGAFVSMFGPDLFGLVAVVILTSLGTWGLPQMVQKFYAIKSGPAIKQGAIISTLFALVVAGGSYFLGGFGRLYGDQIAYAGGVPVYDSIVPTMLSGLPDLLIGLVVVLVLSASMSTLSSLVLTSSSTLTLDLIGTTVATPYDREAQASVDPRAHRVLRGHLGRHRSRAVPLDHHVHRAAHGHLVGCACRRVSGAARVGPVQRPHLQSGRLGELHLRRGTHRVQHVPRLRRLVDHGGCAGDAAVACHRAHREPCHAGGAVRGGAPGGRRRHRPCVPRGARVRRGARHRAVRQR
jgi:SSS family solute:Na+ symporter/sodium/proline symporter